MSVCAWLHMWLFLNHTKIATLNKMQSASLHSLVLLKIWDLWNTRMHEADNIKKGKKC